MKQKKMKQVALTGVLLFSMSITNGQDKLLSIDSLYLATAEQFYKKADQYKNTIWNGMKLAPICLFRADGPAMLYNHPDPPIEFRQLSDKLFIGRQKDLQLFGSTQMEINGTLTAIVDYGSVHFSCIEEVYAELFHELHHVYQGNCIDHIKFDNAAILLTYPENPENDALKNLEQTVLFQMCFEKDHDNFQALLNQFFSCRLKRKQIIGAYLEYEESVENIEGPAFFCEYKYYNTLSGLPGSLRDSYSCQRFFGILTTPYYGRSKLRQRHLASGLAMCYILDQHFSDWEIDYYSKDISLYNFFISRFKPEETSLTIDPSFFCLSAFHTRNTVSQHNLALEEFNDQAGVKVSLEYAKLPVIGGFDPMNAESINDSVILHSTILKLSNGEDNSLSINYYRAVSVIDKEIWNIKKVILYIPEESIMVTNDKLHVDIDGVDISWKGTVKMKNDSEIIFKGE